MVLAAALASTLLATGVVPAGAVAPAVTRLATISPSNGTSSPGAAVAVGGGGGYFFAANDGANGAELHHGDGSGTSTLVKDVNPGVADANPQRLTAVGSTLYFTADDGTHGTQLWKSDGTAAGTTMVRDLGPDAGPDALVASGGRLFFTVRGTDLYVSDGTSAGTRQLRTFGAASSVAPYAGGVAFVGDGAPWVSDGTTGGTHVITTTLIDATGFTDLDGRLYFSAAAASGGHELYRSDGTAGGTAIVKNIASGDADAFPSWLTVVGHELYFAADDVGDGSDVELWKSDGTGGGTVEVKDINSGGSAGPAGLVAFGGQVYFNADDGGGTSLWRSDGTSGGTVAVHDAGGDPVLAPGSLTVSGSSLFFGALDAAHGYELWRTDGTPAGTGLVKDIAPGGDAFGDIMSSIGGGRVMLVADDGVHGREPWVSDGTAAGTRLDDVDLQGLASPTPSVRLGDQQFYVAIGSGSSELRLYVTDGTAAGSRAIPGPTGPSGLTVFRGKVYFAGFDPDSGGTQLWVTDGTAAGTHVVTTVTGLLVQGGAGTVAAAGRYVYFLGGVAATGNELWKTDGTAAGTSLVKDINSRAGVSSNPGSLARFGSRVVLSADDGVHGPELWLSDGTDAGTAMVQDSAGGRPGVSPRGMYAVGCEIYYAADAPGRPDDQELWASDGTAAGTALVKDINSTGPSAPGGFVAAGGKVYFSADPDGSGPEVWVTDGTAAGTRVVDGGNRYVGALTAVGTHVLYSAGTKLYGYDAAGGGAPALVAGSVPFAPPSGAPITVDGDTAYFANADGAHGMELWSTDGTAAGTALAEDLNAGPASSFPVPLGVGSGAPVLTTDTPTDGTVLVRLGDTDASGATDDGDSGPDCLPPPPPDTTTTTTTTTTETQAQTPPPPAPATPAAPAQSQPPLQATSPPPADRRAKPRALSVRITRRTATRLTITGTLKLPSGASRRSCAGTITLTLKQATHTLGHTTAHLTRTCTFRATITTKKPKRTPTPRLTTRFGGNTSLQPTTTNATSRI